MWEIIFTFKRTYNLLDWSALLFGMRIQTPFMLSHDVFKRLHLLPHGTRSGLVNDLLQEYFTKMDKPVVLTEEQIHQRSKQIVLAEFGLPLDTVELPADWTDEQVNRFIERHKAIKEQLRKGSIS